MKIISQIIILGILLSFSLLNGMKKDQKRFQPQSLVSLAAEAIAKDIEPTQSLEKAFHAFKNAHKISSAVEPLISNALFKRKQTTLRTILRSQIPLTLQIDRFNQYPENIYDSTTSGLYVRSKRDGYDPDYPDPLYAGVAELIPDPFVQQAPTQFFQIYSNPNSTKYYDDEEMLSTKDAGPRGMCIWDKKTGACLNDGKVIRAKLLTTYPQIANSDSKLPDLYLYGISSNNSLAWCRFQYLSDAICIFKIENNEIVFSSLHYHVTGPLSPSGNLCAVCRTDSNSTIIVNSNTRFHFNLSFQGDVRSFSPNDDYAIIQKRNTPDTYILNLTTKKLSQLTLNNNQFSLSNGTCNPLNADGTLLAIKEKKEIYILKVHTNELLCTLPVSHSEDDATYCNLQFSPDSTQLLALDVINNTNYHLAVFDIATQECVEELTQEDFVPAADVNDFIFCNDGNYLLFPNGQLRLQPKGLVNHLSLKELLGLLILEQQKTQQQPLNATIIQCLQQNQFPKIQELIARRYGTTQQTP